jgi:formylmethanofuran dehydrogenase subunit A
MVFKRLITTILENEVELLLSRHTNAKAPEIPQMWAEGLDLMGGLRNWGNKFKI